MHSTVDACVQHLYELVGSDLAHTCQIIEEMHAKINIGSCTYYYPETPTYSHTVIHFIMKSTTQIVLQIPASCWIIPFDMIKQQDSEKC